MVDQGSLTDVGSIDSFLANPFKHFCIRAQSKRVFYILQIWRVASFWIFDRSTKIASSCVRNWNSNPVVITFLMSVFSPPCYAKSLSRYCFPSALVTTLHYNHTFHTIVTLYSGVTCSPPSHTTYGQSFVIFWGCAFDLKLWLYTYMCLEMDFT